MSIQQEAVSSLSAVPLGDVHPTYRFGPARLPEIIEFLGKLYAMQANWRQSMSQAKTFGRGPMTRPNKGCPALCGNFSSVVTSIKPWQTLKLQSWVVVVSGAWKRYLTGFRASHQLNPDMPEEK